MGWTVVIPVKPPSRGKSRLAPELAALRAELAAAFARDTITLALAATLVDQVRVVTADPGIADLAQSCGAVVVEDTAGELNAAIRLGVARPDTADPVAALLGDVPGLRPASLDVVLAAVPSRSRGFVPDAEGRGTTLLAAVGLPLDPSFGSGSAAAHEDSGAVRLEAAADLRHDVDTADDLRRLVAAGIDPGPATTAVITAHPEILTPPDGNEPGPTVDLSTVGPGS